MKSAISRRKSGYFESFAEELLNGLLCHYEPPNRSRRLKGILRLPGDINNHGRSVRWRDIEQRKNASMVPFLSKNSGAGHIGGEVHTKAGAQNAPQGVLSTLPATATQLELRIKRTRSPLPPAAPSAGQLLQDYEENIGAENQSDDDEEEVDEATMKSIRNWTARIKNLDRQPIRQPMRQPIRQPIRHPIRQQVASDVECRNDSANLRGPEEEEGQVSGRGRLPSKSKERSSDRPRSRSPWRLLRSNSKSAENEKRTASAVHRPQQPDDRSSSAQPSRSSVTSHIATNGTWQSQSPEEKSSNRLFKLGRGLGKKKVPRSSGRDFVIPDVGQQRTHRVDDKQCKNNTYSGFQSTNWDVGYELHAQHRPINCNSRNEHQHYSQPTPSPRYHQQQPHPYYH